jgi:hypothetical protein
MWSAAWADAPPPKTIRTGLENDHIRFSPWQRRFALLPQMLAARPAMDKLIFFRK